MLMQDELAQLKRQRQLEREVSARDAKRMAASQEGKKVGDAGYRYHARVPRFAQPAYVNAPEVPDSVRAALPAVIVPVMVWRLNVKLRSCACGCQPSPNLHNLCAGEESWCREGRERQGQSRAHQQDHIAVAAAEERR